MWHSNPHIPANIGKFINSQKLSKLVQTVNSKTSVSLVQLQGQIMQSSSLTCIWPNFALVVSLQPNSVVRFSAYLLMWSLIVQIVSSSNTSLDQHPNSNVESVIIRFQTISLLIYWEGIRAAFWVHKMLLLTLNVRFTLTFSRYSTVPHAKIMINK